MAWIRLKARKKGESAGYYLVESRRTGPNKQPREHIIKYIGTLDNLIAFATDAYNNSVKLANQSSGPPPKQPDLAEIFSSGIEIVSYEHGAVMSMYWAAKAIGVEKILDEVIPPKCIHGMKRSRVLLLAMIHRGVHPGSKASFEEWVHTTSLPHFLSFDPNNLDSQAFWTAMDGITVEMMQTVNVKIVKRLIVMFDIKIDVLNLDYTNFFTFISTWNGHCFICFRGHNKQKRDDLRQFSLAMLTHQILNIPIIWDIYEGNKNDIQEFPDFIKKIEEGLAKLGVDKSEVTLVFDAGSVSEDNFKDLAFHYICAHSVGEAHLEGNAEESLYDIDLDDYQSVTLENGDSRLAYRVPDLKYAGVKGLGILTHSEELEKNQKKELETRISNLKESLHELNERLKSPKSRIVKSHEKRRIEWEKRRQEINQFNEGLDRQRTLLKEKGESATGLGRKKKQLPEWDDGADMRDAVEKDLFPTRKISELKSFISVSLAREDDHYQASLQVDNDKKTAYCRKYYGKKLTVTDQVDWTTEKILSKYIGQECIENGIFRLSKNSFHFSVTPQYHWLDRMIRVHVFLCLISMTIAETIRLKLENHGIKLSTTAMLDKLELIREAIVMRNLPDGKTGKAEALWQPEKITDSEAQAIWQVIQAEFNKKGSKT